MNQETNSGAQRTQQERAAPHKRNNKASRNRPVLVNPILEDQVTDDQVEEISNATQPVEEVAATMKAEDARPRRLPKFFSSVGKNEKEQTVESEQAAARIARATRSTGASAVSSRTVKESKPVKPASSANKTASTTKASAKVAPASASRPTGGFKSRYLWGILIYMSVALLVGGFERNLMVANHLEKLLFQIGPVAVTTSTALYLLTLIVILVLLARFDLVPRSLGAMAGQPTPQRGKPGQSKNTSGSDIDKSSQPTMKQGVKGADDDLYQEYREQQRYLQRRERKK